MYNYVSFLSRSMDSTNAFHGTKLTMESKEFLTQLAFLWFAGFKEACSFHRLILFCRRSRRLLQRTGQCFLLNGCIFLGSILLVQSMITPMLQWILPVSSQQQNTIFLQWCPVSKAGENIHSVFQAILMSFFYVLWFYPMYVLSFIISSIWEYENIRVSELLAKRINVTIWYNEIAREACLVMKHIEEPLSKKHEETTLNSETPEKRGGFDEIMIMIGEQIYSVLMLSVFFIEVSAIAFIPYFGKAMSFLLLTWVYAYYCFEYKWNFIGWSLKERIDFFEKNWAFFAGFGSPCVLATFFSSQLISSGIMALLYPLFVLSATASNAQQVIAYHARQQTQSRLGRIPIFFMANATSVRLLKCLQNV